MGSGEVTISVGDDAAMSRRTLVDDAERAVRRWVTPIRFRRGDRLPPEHELARMLGISRGTLRGALRRLESTGAIVRRQGSGTFVGELGPPDGGVRELTLTSSSARVRGSALSATDVRIDRRPAGSPAAEALGIDGARPAARISRTLVGASGRPVAVAQDVVHPDVRLPGTAALRRAVEVEGRLLDLLGLGADAPPGELRTRITPILLRPEDELGARMRIELPVACVRLEEVVTSSLGRPLMFSTDVFTAEAIEIELRQATDAPPAVIRGAD